MLKLIQWRCPNEMNIFWIFCFFFLFIMKNSIFLLNFIWEVHLGNYCFPAKTQAKYLHNHKDEELYYVAFLNICHRCVGKEWTTQPCSTAGFLTICVATNVSVILNVFSDAAEHEWTSVTSALCSLCQIISKCTFVIFKHKCILYQVIFNLV